MNKYGDLLTNEFNRMVNVDLMSFMDNLSDESATFIASEGFEVPDKVTLPPSLSIFQITVRCHFRYLV